MARTQADALRHDFDGKVFLQIGNEPGREVCETIRRASLELQRLGILHLPAGPLQVDNEIARGRERNAAAKIRLDEGEREINARGYAGGGVDVSVADIDRVRLEPDARIAPREIGR